MFAKSWLKRIAFLLLAFSLVLALSPTPAAYAATITVTTDADSGAGSLRQAIADAVAGNTITFSGDFTITLSSTLTITQDLTIDGAGHSVTVSGNNVMRVFYVNYGITFNLQNLTVANGNCGIGCHAGGIYNYRGTVVVTNCTFSSNHANDGWGGGIYNEGTLTVTSSTFSDNVAHEGGGIAQEVMGTLNVTNSTFSHNSVDDGGGGIFNHGGILNVTNSTFSYNSAIGGGGGIFNANYWASVPGTLTVTNSTFSGNSAPIYGGGIFNSASTATLRNTIIVNSPSGGDCNNYGAGSITAESDNLADESTCGNATVMTTAQINLQALANNGGATQTMALAYNSPAIDAANPATCPATDQRGVPRPQGPACDRGAYEAAPDLTLTKSVIPVAPLYHGVVTYTVNLTNSGIVTDANVLFTDMLPTSVAFGAWLEQPAGAVAAGNAITWTGALIPGGALTFRFTATHTGAPREWVTNTATFSGSVQTGSASAGFQVTAYVITPTASVGGSITPSTPQVVDAGADRVFTIAPNYGYHILDVAIDGTSIGAVNVYTFTNVNADHTITAAFDLNDYALTTNTIGQGQITRTPDQATYLFGSVVTLTAVPQPGWYFGQWTGGASGTLTQTTVLMNANKVVTATFFNVPQTYYTLTLSLIGSGLITPTVGAHPYLSGTVVPLSTSPTEGWQFAGWSGDVDCANGSVTMNANKNCTAAFALNVYVITPTAGTNGSITPDTPQTVNHGESITFTIAPAVGYHILDVGVDGASLGAVSIYTFANVTADHTLSATFALNEYTLTAGVIGQGQVTRTPNQATYFYGSVVTLTAVPEPSWYFGQWLGDASGILTQTTVLMDANKVVTATFLNTPPTYYTLTLSLIGSGVITPTVGAHPYLSGTVVPLSTSPAAGWQFAGWSGDVVTTSNPITVTMSSNQTITATFALKPYLIYLPSIMR